MPILQKRLQFGALAFLAEKMLSGLASTWSVAVHDKDRVIKGINKRRYPSIVTFWHRNLLTLLPLFSNLPVCIPVSEHKDGEYVAHLIDRFGMHTVRGSTTRNSLNVMRGLIDNLNSGVSCAITPDGPKGPNKSVQPGFILLSRKTKTPVIPLGVAVNKGWVFNSWDKLILPKPYSQIQLIFGKPIDLKVGRDSSSQNCKILREATLKLDDKAASIVKGSV